MATVRVATVVDDLAPCGGCKHPMNEHKSSPAGGPLFWCRTTYCHCPNYRFNMGSYRTIRYVLEPVS